MTSSTASNAPEISETKTLMQKVKHVFGDIFHALATSMAVQTRGYSLGTYKSVRTPISEEYTENGARKSKENGTTIVKSPELI